MIKCHWTHLQTPNTTTKTKHLAASRLPATQSASLSPPFPPCCELHDEQGATFQCQKHQGKGHLREIFQSQNVASPGDDERNFGKRKGPSWAAQFDLKQKTWRFFASQEPAKRKRKVPNNIMGRFESITRAAEKKAARTTTNTNAKQSPKQNKTHTFKPWSVWLECIPDKAAASIRLQTTLQRKLLVGFPHPLELSNGGASEECNFQPTPP